MRGSNEYVQWNAIPIRSKCEYSGPNIGKLNWRGKRYDISIALLSQDDTRSATSMRMDAAIGESGPVSLYSNQIQQVAKMDESLKPSSLLSQWKVDDLALLQYICARAVTAMKHSMEYIVLY